MKYYGYCRVSTETQSEKGYGLDAQRNEITKYANENGITIEQVFTDEGISGNIKDTDDDDAINKRAGLIELLSVMEADDVVIVLNTARLWRSDTTKVIVRRALKKINAKVVSIENPRYDLYTKNPNERLIDTIMEAMDEWERATIAIKLAKGRCTKARKGDKPAGVTAYGYRYTADKKAVEIDQGEAETIRYMFTEAQKGASLGDIADALNSQGKQTRQGKQWQRGSVAAILHNGFYTGELQHQGQTIKGNHEAIISKVQFGKVQAQLERKSKR